MIGDAVFRLVPQAAFKSLPDRCEAFDRGQISIDGIVMLMQDLILLGILPNLPMKFAVAAQHCVDSGLCSCPGRMTQ